MSFPALTFATGRTPDEIQSHPRFTEARRSYLRAVLALYENDAFMSRLLMEGARSLVFFNAICLFFAQHADERATWPTMGLLQHHVAQFGLSSSRRVEDLMARFIQAGYFRSDVAPSDRRMRILTPTEKALAHDRAWLAAHFVPLKIMFPGFGYEVPCALDVGFQAAQRRVGIGMAAYGVQALATNPAILQFMMRDCGSMVLMKLVALADAAGDPSTCRIPFADLARSFGVSRTHVRDILHDAEAQALVEVRDAQIALSPNLLGAFDRFVATVMANHAETFERATRERDAA